LEVILNEGAFISIVTAAVETFPDETLGVLIGLRKADKVMVQYAIAYQTAKRRRRGVEAHPRLSRRMYLFLEKVTHLEIIGDFHSHPEVGVDKKSSIKLSEPDKKSMRVNNLGIVIAIDKDGRKLGWKHLPKGSLKGSVSPYTLKMTTWLKTQEKQYKIAENFCPFALGLGR
jgi:proteasome lid subunit RPN8/RPN11